MSASVMTKRPLFTAEELAEIARADAEIERNIRRENYDKAYYRAHRENILEKKREQYAAGKVKRI